LKVVLVVKDGTIIVTPVTLGERFGGLVEITGGISAGDLVVGKPAENLKTGMKVKIKK
jgi:multidrug efflux pump subunit AcrA (membrane-fusion protein)